MKKAITWFSALAVMCLMAIPAAAQYVTPGELNNFNAFLNGHPNIASQLRRNPGLVDNAGYLQEHPELHSYLADHDQLRRAVQDHPGQFMYSGGRYSYGWGTNRNYYYRGTSQEQWEQMHNYGHYDPDDRQWHDRDWWEHNRADWVREHHPRWEAARADMREDYNEWKQHHGDSDHHDHDNGQHKGGDHQHDHNHD